MSLYNPSLSAPLSTTVNPMYGFASGTPYHGQTISRAHLAAQYDRNRYYQDNSTVSCKCNGCVSGKKCSFCKDTHEGAYCCDHQSCTNHPGKSCK